MKNKITLMLIIIALASLGTASNFQVSSTDYDNALEEKETLQVDTVIQNTGNSGIQTVELLKSDSKVSVQELKLEKDQSQTVSLSYDIESGDAQSNAEFTVRTSNDTENLDVDIATLEKAFTEGWNYFSLPISTQSRPEISSILPDNKISSVWRFEDGGWESYAPTAQENPFNSFKGGEGYIVKAEEDFTVRPVVQNTMDVESVENSNPASEDLQQGWNLIGHYWEEKQNSGINYALDTLPVSSSGGTYKQASDGNLSLVSLDGEFKPGGAYWQFVNTDTAYGKSESDPTTPNSCCDAGYAVKKVPRINDRTDSSVLKNNTANLKLRVNDYYFSSEAYLNKTELEEKTITSAYISNNTTVNQADYDSSEFKKICKEDTKLDSNNFLKCGLDTENLSYSKYSVHWNVTRKDEYHWRSDSENIEIKSKRVPSFRAVFNNFYDEYSNRFLIENQTGELELERFSAHTDQYLNDTELESKTRTRVYISDYEPNESSNYSSSNFKKICDMKTELTNEKIKCDISTNNLGSGKKWISYNISRNDDLRWMSHSETFNILDNTFEPYENHSIDNYTVKINEINSIEKSRQYETTLNFTIYSDNDDKSLSEYKIKVFDANRNEVGRELFDSSRQIEDAIQFENGKATVEERIGTDGEAKYLLIQAEDQDIRYMFNLTDEIFGSLPDLRTHIGPKLTEETTKINQGVDINLSYNGGSSGDLTRKEFTQTSSVSISIINRTEVYKATGESISARDLEGKRDEYKEFERLVCTDIAPSENGWANCSISESELEAGREYLISWQIKNEKNQEKNGEASFTAVRVLDEDMMAENSEVKINVSDIGVNEPSEGWKEFEMSSYLHNKNMTYSDNNATRAIFSVLNDDGKAIAAESSNARLSGPYGVRKGYNETDNYMQETVVDDAEPSYILAQVDYGNLYDVFSFAFEIDRSDLG